MHDDDAVDVQQAMQRIEIGDRGRAGRVAPLRRQREFFGRPENMGVAVAGALRHVERDGGRRDAENGKNGLTGGHRQPFAIA